MQDQNEFLNEYKSHILENQAMIKLEEHMEPLEMTIYDPIKDDVTVKTITDFMGKYVVLFFYPADFTFVCPTELKDLNNSYDKFKEMGDVEVLVVSTDTVFSHRAWVLQEPLLKGFQIPMVSDRSTLLSRYFGIMNSQTGNAERGTFILDRDGILKSVEIITEAVGRSSNELIRKIAALKFVQDNKGMACPASWNGTMPVLKPSLQIAGNVGNNFHEIN